MKPLGHTFSAGSTYGGCAQGLFPAPRGEARSKHFSGWEGQLKSCLATFVVFGMRLAKNAKHSVSHRGGQKTSRALKVLPTRLVDALPAVVLALLQQNALLAQGHHTAPRVLRDDR